MQIIYHLIIDMARPLPVAPVSAVQNDANTRAIRVSLLENGEPWTVPEGITAAVAFRKPDRTKGLYDTLPDGTKAVTVDGSTVTAVLAPQVLSCAGEVSAAIVLYDGALNQLATFPFTIRVEKNPAAGQTVSNDYYKYSTMEAVSEAVDGFLSKAEEALTVVHDTATEDAPAIICEASGAVITAEDAANRPLSGLSLYGKTVQNGTPTPENPAVLESAGESGAINTTVCGKNIAYNIFVGTSTNQYDAILQCAVDGLEPSTNYVISFVGTVGYKIYANESLFNYVDVTCTGGRQSLVLKTRASISKESISQYQNGRWIIFKNNESGKTPNFKDVQIERGTIATEFEPYKEAQTLTASTPNGLPGIPVSSGGNYTDENGQQWICDEIDFARGVYVKRIQDLRITNTDMVAVVNYNANNPCVQFVCQLTKTASTRKCLSPWIRYVSYGIDGGSSAGCYIHADTTVTFGITKEFLHGYGAVAGDSASYKPAFDAWAKELIEAGTPLSFQYALATPIETALSAEEMAQYAALHTNKPNTTVFNDSNAGMKLSYVADTKTYIDNKLAAISAAMLNA